MVASKSGTKATEKKQKFKAGQKKMKPEKTDPLFKFYSSLYKQNPSSMMAMTWMLEHGCLTPKKTEAALLIIAMAKLKIKK